MKRFVFGFLAVLVLVSGCSSVKPDAGEEAVLTRKPFFFGNGGVDPNPVKPGRKWVAVTTKHLVVNMQPQLFRIHFDDFMSKDGVPLDFDVALRLKITDSVKMARDFGLDPVEMIVHNTKYVYPKWYVINVHKNLENSVRQAVRKHGMNETAISTTAIDQIDEEITGALKEYIQKVQLPAELVDFTVGRANPPDAVKNQRIETATQEQRVNTEKQRKLAEDQRKMAEQSRANADNAYRNAMGLSPEQFIRLETIKMQYVVCSKDAAHCNFVFGGGAVPTLDVGRK